MSSLATAELARDPRVVAGPRGAAGAASQTARARVSGRSAGSSASAPRPRGKPLGTAAPLIGFLTDRSLLAQPERCSIGGWTRPVLEPEVAARLGRPLAPGGSLDEAAAAIDGLAPAFELADLDPPPTDVERVLAGNVFHRAVVLGPYADPALAPMEDLRAELTCGEDTEAVDDPQEATGPIVALVRHVADLLGYFGLELGAGEMVICGSIVPPIAVAAGRRLPVPAAADRRALDRAHGLMAGLAAVAPAVGGRASRAVVGAIVFAVAVASFSRIPLLPDIGADLSLGAGEIGLLTTAFGLGRLAMDLPAGPARRRDRADDGVGGRPGSGSPSARRCSPLRARSGSRSPPRR